MDLGIVLKIRILRMGTSKNLEFRKWASITSIPYEVECTINRGFSRCPNLQPIVDGVDLVDWELALGFPAAQRHVGASRGGGDLPTAKTVLYS